MQLFYNGDNVSCVMENDYWTSYWSNGEDTEIDFIFDDYEESEKILEFLEELNLDYNSEDDNEKIDNILAQKLHKKHFSSYEYYDKNTKDFLEIIMTKILEEYPTIKANIEKMFADEDISDEMPKISSIEDLKKYIQPQRIYFHENGNIGVGFNCEWEEEHGLGILFNEKDGVLEIGDFPVAF